MNVDYENMTNFAVLIKIINDLQQRVETWLKLSTRSTKGFFLRIPIGRGLVMAKPY